MSVSLSKGRNISLSKAEPGLKEIVVGLGWDPRSSEGAKFDLDASVFMVKADGKVRSDADFIFYNNLVSTCGSVRHTGDNRTVTIDSADTRHQNFGQVGSAFIRIINDERGSEITRFDLVEEASMETSMIFGEVYRYNTEWKFRAVGQGYRGGLADMARMLGVNI